MSTLGGPPKTTLGATPTATTLGGSTTLGGAPKAATTLGGAPKAATTLGGSTTLGGAPKTTTTLGGSTTLGGAPKAATTLGGAPATTLGGAPKASTTLGSTTLGGAAKTGTTTLGGSSTTLGGAPAKTVDTEAASASETKEDEIKQTSGDLTETAPTNNKEDAAGGDDDDDDGEDAGNAASSSAAGKKKKKKKPAKKTDAAEAAPAAKKGSKLSGLAEKLRKEKEERERLQREEEERIRLEEEAEMRRAELAKIAAEKAAQEAAERSIRDKAAAEDRKKQEAIAKRAAMLNRFAGAKVVGIQQQGATATGAAPTASTSGSSQAGKKKAAKERKQQVEAAEAARLESEQKEQESAAAAANAQKASKSWDESSDEEDEDEDGEGKANGHNGDLKSSAGITDLNSADSGDAEIEDDLKGKKLRSPICCVLGHVDTGKTKLLDKMRNTNVQDGEVRGITQQIGATYFPMEAIKSFTSELNERHKLQFKVPGLLIMDTPGHASFSNLRNRGSSLCDIAVLVVDIMHGLEPMTIESLNMLRSKKVPFVVALNKVDRLFEWKAFKNKHIGYSLKNQAQHVLGEYQTKVNNVIAQFAEQNLNADLYYNLKNLRDFTRQVCLVPTSALTGEGIPDLLSLLVQLTQRLMTDRLILKEELQCSVLEVKQLEGHGTTIDVILASGTLNEGDRIIVCGLSGPIDTRIRALLTPPPLRELRIKDKYQHHKSISAAQGLKISAQGLDKALAGSQLFVVHDESEVEEYCDIVVQPLKQLREKVPKVSHGVYVQASTLGSLEALLDFLTTECKIPIAEFSVGPIHPRDVKFASVMMEKAPDYACILAFDVAISPEARTLAHDLKVKIFQADVIYDLEKQFKDHIEALAAAKKEKSKAEIVWPCALAIKQDFRKRDPIILGVTVKHGVVKLGTPLVVGVQGGWLELGRISGIQREGKDVEECGAGEDTAIAINQPDGAQKLMFGRHFDETNGEIYSRITRTSLDALKEHHLDFVKDPPNYKLLMRLKQVFIDQSPVFVVPSDNA